MKNKSFFLENKKFTYIIVFLLFLGIIVGPINSVLTYNNFSKVQSTYGTQYDSFPSQTTFLPFNKRIFGSIGLTGFSFHNSSLYLMIMPNQNLNNGVYDDFSNNGTYEFLEVNFTNNFNGLASITSYKLWHYSAYSYYYSGLFLDGNQFWTYSYYPSSLVSFNKVGTVLQNKTLVSPISNNSSYIPEFNTPLGIFNNQFWLLENGYYQAPGQNKELFENISSYSLSTFTRSFSRSIENIGQSFIGNIDGNTLWLRFFALPVDNISYYNSANQTVSESYYGFPMNEILNSPTLTINQAILVNGLNGIETLGPSYNLPSLGWTAQTFPYTESIHDHKIFRIEFGTFIEPYQNLYNSSLGTPGGQLFLGVEINTPVIYQVGINSIITMFFGYAITGVMAVLLLIRYLIRPTHQIKS